MKLGPRPPGSGLEAKASIFNGVQRGEKWGARTSYGELKNSYWVNLTGTTRGQEGPTAPPSWLSCIFCTLERKNPMGGCW